MTSQQFYRTGAQRGRTRPCTASQEGRLLARAAAALRCGLGGKLTLPSDEAIRKLTGLPLVRSSLTPQRLPAAPSGWSATRTEVALPQFFRCDPSAPRGVLKSTALLLA